MSPLNPDHITMTRQEAEAHNAAQPKLYLLRIWPQVYPNGEGWGDWLDAMFTNREHAVTFLACWVRTHWNNDRDERKDPIPATPPTDDAEVIRLYFSDRDQIVDRYQIDEREVDPVWVPDEDEA
jgi:hypothetical protein